MIHNHKPTLEELSLYYDGLLDAKRQSEVNAWLENDPASKQTLAAFELFDRSLQPELKHDELDGFLSDTLQNVHAQIYAEDRVAKYQSASWLVWLSPKVLVPALGIAVAVFAVIVTINNMNSVDSTGEQSAPPEIIVENPNPINDIMEEESAIDETLQREAMLATARFAKNWMDAGMQYANANREQVTQPLQELKTSAEKALTLSTIPSLLPRTEAEPNTEVSTPPSAIATLAKAGQQQVAIGLGVSLLAFASNL